MGTQHKELEEDYSCDQIGNYFIMDSESLISNPFQELQQEAINEAQSKNSNTEKLTSVKNNVCENHFNMTKTRLERQKVSELKKLHDHTNRLRHEVKLLDLDRQRHQVEVKKRMEPERDYSYDDMQIINMEKRLGANIASFYLDKKLKYPTRLRSVSDISITPVVRKARATLRMQDLQKSMDDQLGSRQERVHTAKSVSTSYTTPCVIGRRRGSRSAPVYARSLQDDNGKYDSDSLPAISPPKSQPAPNGQFNSYKYKSLQQQQQQPPQVKFAFENPLKILASSEESAKLFTRSHTYYPGATRAINIACDSDDDEDDDASLPEYIDLKAFFAGKEADGSQSDDALTFAQSQQALHQYLLALRRAQGPAPQMTMDMKQVQANYINSKVQKFMDNLAIPTRPKETTVDILETLQLQANRPQTTFHARGTNTDDRPPQPLSSNTKSTSTSDLFANNAQTSDTTNNNPTEADNTSKPKEQDQEQSPRAKYNWKYIRGRAADGQLRGTYKSEDLVLQSLTGVPISNVIQTHVPLHSASRAMRHTATFKMHKIVEKLINERTKYERVQVEELKRQMGGADDAMASPPDKLSHRSSDVREPLRRTSSMVEPQRRASTVSGPSRQVSTTNEPQKRMTSFVSVR